MPNEDTQLPILSDKEYTEELERIIIFLCDVYTKGADSLSVQVNDDGQVDDKWMGIYMSFPTIQGTGNRMSVEKIGNLRTLNLNREAPKLNFQDLYKILNKTRRDKR